MPQFFVDTKMEAGLEVEIRGGDARHIARSLRLAAGDWLVLSDGAGRAFHAKIMRTSASAVHALIEREIVRRERSEPPLLALALASREHFEFAVQKAVELGCRHIMPFSSRRSEKMREGAQASSRLARWKKIAEEAAKQSGLPFLPAIEEPIEFSSIFIAVRQGCPCFVLYEGEEELGLRSAIRSLANDSGLKAASPMIVIGPEGGFADDEIDIAKESGAITVSLGRQILRVETAAIAALTICQYELGNMDPC